MKKTVHHNFCIQMSLQKRWLHTYFYRYASNSRRINTALGAWTALTAARGQLNALYSTNRSMKRSLTTAIVKNLQFEA